VFLHVSTHKGSSSSAAEAAAAAAKKTHQIILNKTDVTILLIIKMV
jgi:mevalonate pyrophosphate decarboxylase